MSLTIFYQWGVVTVKLLLCCVLLIPTMLAPIGGPPSPTVRLVLSEKDLLCLATNAYHEARGEPKEGILGVIAVSMNRMMHPKFPSGACAVVHQKRGGVCQFSWYCDERIKPPSPSALARFKALAMEYNYRLHADPTNGSIYFHTLSVKPYWSRKATPQVVLNNHVFFKDLK